ncbi:LytTR family DNA-binding domain-containing protein [Bacteroides sp. 14(A)]|uniref:LytR/AlgR family response regulator transcription factor n=1 Tax=Bacteroides sp. 14(A) TaxID=1163670 RepID=UPI0004B6B719|nr:response regulator transcription factor [Bacteroides sp. 14(A)]
MRIRCIVIDDEPIALGKLRKYVGQTPYLELVAACDSPIGAMRVLSEENVDAIFTDINMLGLNGLDFVSSLSKCPLVVFITAYPEYAVDSYKIGAVDYIVKPYGFKEFQRAADRVRIQFELMQRSNATFRDNSVFVRAGCKWVRVRIGDIRYIQGLCDYLRVSLAGSPKPLVIYATFAHMKSCLPANFLQVHRSWIVNVEHIREIERGRIVMDKDMYIPVSDSFKESLALYLQDRSIGKTGSRSKDSD